MNIDWENDDIYDDFNVTDKIQHTYNPSGTYDVAIQGVFPAIKMAISNFSNKKN